MTVRVGVVTVTFRGGDKPIGWAAALRVAAAAAPDVVVQAVAVDNASGDRTAARLRVAEPWVDVVEVDRNRGFAAGCNIGVAALDAPDIIALVNPDARVAPDFFCALAALAWPPDLAARGPLIIGAAGAVEQSARGFPQASTALFGRTSLLARILPRSRATRRELRAAPDRGTADVDWVSGACLLTTAAAWRRVGGLDEAYFMYWEDADWCKRAHDLRLRVQYEPALTVHHDQGSSSSSRPAATIIAFHRSAMRYWSTHVATGLLSRSMAAAALTLRCGFRLGAAAVRARAITAARRDRA